MNNQISQNWLWQGLGATVWALTVVTDPAFAVGGSCANPFDLNINSQVKMRFCDIPVAQGSAVGKTNDGKTDNGAEHAKRLSRFQVAQFETTQLVYKTVIGGEPWKNANGVVKDGVKEGDNNPAVYVSCVDARVFVAALNSFDKTATYRLPTKVEFEYATRAGTSTKYFWGNDIDATLVYFWENTKNTGRYAREVHSCPIPILSQGNPGYCANDFGLYHMLGNVSEWTFDIVQSWVRGDVSVCAFNGGSWYDGAEELRAGNSMAWYHSGGVDNVIGFRVVRTAK